MLEAFRKAFKIKDIRKKIGYTIFDVNRNTNWIAVANTRRKW